VDHNGADTDARAKASQYYLEMDRMLHRGSEPWSGVETDKWMKTRRWIDVSIVLLASPLLVPIASIAAFAVWLEDGEKPIVRLQRSGRYGRLLSVAKIRSMSTRKETADQRITQAKDPRVTRIGRLLRRLRIDEIPQVVQVARGEMALIGPRPEDPAFIDLDDPQWIEVLRLRPAIAGLTQIIASSWESEHLEGPDAQQLYRQVAVPAKLAIDHWYVRHASPRVDWMIVTSLGRYLLFGQQDTPAHHLVRQQIPEALPLLT